MPRATRFALRVPVRYREQQGEWRDSRSIDVSATGVLLDAGEPLPPIGACIDVVLTLFVFGGPLPGLSVACRGRVARCVPATSDRAAAVAVHVERWLTAG